MGKFKCRAWDEGNKVMHSDVQFISSGDSGNDWIIFKSDKQSVGDDWKETCIADDDALKTDVRNKVLDNPYFSQQIKIMRCAELSDKNGKDIYEGDFVKITKNNIIGVVGFALGSFYIKIESGTVSLFGDELEVIGNIYENPDIKIGIYINDIKMGIYVND